VNELQNLLNNLWTGTIESHVFDIYNHVIQLNVKVIRDNRISHHCLKFRGVKSIYYINDQYPFSPEKDDYLELTSVTYESESLRKIKVASLSKDFSHLTSNTNFSIEIWGREIFIHAASIEVDGKIFEIQV